MKLSATRVDGHVTTTRNGREAVYRLGPQRWAFRSTAEREQLITTAAVAYAGLIGRRLRIRVTSRPYPVDQWAREVDAAFPHSLPGWAEHLRDEQRHIHSLTLASKEVYLTVQLHTPALRKTAADEELRKVAGAVAALDARPATPAEVEYLLHRSVSLGAPAPHTLPPPAGVWETEDVDQFTDRATWSTRPFDRTVRVVADVNGRQHVRHVAVLTLGRMQDLDIPGTMEPWLHRADRLGFPVEWAVTADILETGRVRKELQDTLARIKAQVAHYADHDEIPPAALTRQEARAVQVEDEVTATDPLATRVHAWVRATVSGVTEAEALDRANALTDLYLPRLPFARGADQYRTAREFILGEPLANSGHKRRMPVTTFAGGMPAVTAVVGDRSGFHIGSTAGTGRRAVCWHPWAAMEQRERSGTTVVSGVPGSGKSSLLGVVVYWAALAGVRTVVLDPSGPLARLTTIPALRSRSRAVDLMNAAPGALNPYSVIGDPRRDHYDTDDLYRRAVRSTEAARQALCSDVLFGLLPLSLVREVGTQMALDDAVALVPGHPGSSPRSVIAALAGSNEPHARYVGRKLAAVAELPQAQLIFPPEHGHHPDASTDHVLQVLTMRGNILPEHGKPREEWTIAETVGVPLMTLAAHLTSRHVYAADMNQRKLLALDEVHDLTRVAAGQTLIRQLSRDTRKFNVRAVLSSQNTADVLAAGIGNLLDNAFVGRTEGETEQGDALKTLGVPRDAGYESVLGGLSPRRRQTEERTGSREFVFADGDGGVEKVRVEIPDALRAVLDTTAAPTQVPAEANGHKKVLA